MSKRRASHARKIAPTGLSWVLIALGVIVVGLMIVVAAHGEEAAPCAPCEIIGTIAKADGTPVKEYKYPFYYATLVQCENERSQDYFKSAMEDLQAKADSFVQLGLTDLKATSACVQLGPIGGLNK
jgi:hypothetical protein